MGFEFADVDGDGKTDIVSLVQHRLTAQLSRANGTFELRELGISVDSPLIKDYVVDPGKDSVAPVLHLLYELSSCRPCGAGCSGRCLFDVACVSCVSDADCSAARCIDQTCTQ